MTVSFGTGWKAATMNKPDEHKPKYFQGEVCTCLSCGVRIKSDPNKQSNWTAIELDYGAYYFCPKCFGNGKPYYGIGTKKMIERCMKLAINRDREIGQM